jgi:transposase-like protein
MEQNQAVRQTRRRRHSLEFKQKVVQACRQPGVSIAAVALRYQLNANLLRRWVAAYEERDTAASVPEPVILPAAEFVALPLEVPLEPVASQDIVIEVRRGASTVTVRWPHAAAAACANWLQGWLR